MLKLVRVAPSFFQIRLFSKFDEREIEVVDAGKKVTRISVADSGVLRITSGQGRHVEVGRESFPFPEGTYRVIPKAHVSYGRVYRGSLSIARRMKAGSKGAFLETVLRVSEEDYLASVVACERIPDSPLEAQKALAICARSFARYLPQSEGKKIFSDLTEDQVFKGLEASDATSLLACRQTEGLVILTDDELFFPAYYASTAGRTTTTPAHVWGSNAFERYFASVSNFSANGEWLDLNSPHAHWSYVLPRAFVLELFPNESGFPKIEYGNKKINKLYLDQTTINGWDFRQIVCLRYGWASMKSLECRIQVGEKGGWKISGAGFGHGVGMSVYGSSRLAKKGFDFKQILAFYFPRLKLGGERQPSD